MSTSNAPQKEAPEFNKSVEIAKAQDYLRQFKDEGKTIDSKNKEKILELAGAFQNNSNFTYARRLYQMLYQKFEKDKKIIEKLAVCTYKDTDLSSDIKYNIAEKLLKDNFGAGENNEINNAKILAVLGSIYKKKWKYENNDGHLYLSLRYYSQGYKIAVTNDDFSNIGFCGINLAFVYDLLAKLESHQAPKRKNGLSSTDADPFADTANTYAQRAKETRTEIRLAYEQKYATYLETWENDSKEKESFDKYERFWFFVTWAEALMGIGEDEGKEYFSEATEKFQKAVETGKVPFWQRHTSSIQGFQLIELLYDDKPEQKEKAQEGLKVLLNVDYVPDNHTDKIGLGFSGGGFRASIFHIGVLAKLAEADLLRRVEVISCVSGGSILGAYYYLKLKKMLEAEPEKDKNGNEIKLGKQDYINLVAELEKEFLDGVNKNVRINILSNIRANIKMAFSPKYTRSLRTAELYDKFFYNRFIDKGRDKGGKILGGTDKRDHSRMYMHDLLITPWGKKSFRPDRDNWKEENKVPILILNATALNTGHCWQFTASWMGESPAYINSEFDALPNLRRMYYEEAPGKYQENIPLSIAVTASAGVPGLFAPIEFDKLYRDNVKLLLVDGGVHDNQGLSTLYEQECNRIVVSDASGQMVEVPRPSSGVFGVTMRTNGILQNRIRFSQFRDLEARKNSGVIRDYMLMHFTKDLTGDVISWQQCQDPYISPDSEDLNRTDSDSTDYNIRIGIQKLLARIRTDLDAFHDTEASTLMYSGYSMTAREIETSTSSVFKMPDDEDADRDFSETWKFLAVQDVHDSDDLNDEFERKLIPSSKLMGKSFVLSKSGRMVLKIWKIVALIVLAVFLFLNANTILSAIGSFDYAAFFRKLITPKYLIWIGAILLLFPVMAILMKILNWFSNGWYMREGRLPGE